MRAFALATAFILQFSQTRGADFNVRVEDSFFEPLQLAVNVGDTVVWRGFGAQDHSVTSDNNLFNALVLFGDTFSYTFDQPGTYPYFCENHGSAGGGGMAGVIVVSAGGVNHPPNTPVNQSPANGATNQSLTLQMRANAFSDPDVQDFHGASQWLVRRASDNMIVFNTGEDSVNKTNRSVTDGILAYGSNYTWQVRYKDGRGQWSQYSSPTTFATLVPVVETGAGLLARYGNSAEAPFLALTTNTTINFEWGAARPHRRITTDDFVALWEGFILPQFSERYDFQFHYRGRARVWVNGQLLINEWNGCSFAQTRRGGINLVAAQLAAIRVEYVASAAGALAALRWTSPSQAMQIIPSARLFPTSP
jgi:plastocyanin